MGRRGGEARIAELRRRVLRVAIALQHRGLKWGSARRTEFASNLLNKPAIDDVMDVQGRERECFPIRGLEQRRAFF